MVRWRWEREGVKDGCYIYCWQQQRVRGRTAQLSDISSGATCVADLDSQALALTKEASGNSRGPNDGRATNLEQLKPTTQPENSLHMQEGFMKKDPKKRTVSHFRLYPLSINKMVANRKPRLIYRVKTQTNLSG